MNLEKEREEISEVIDQLLVVQKIMDQLNLYYSKSMSRALRAKIRIAKITLQEMQRSLLEKDKDYIEKNASNIKPGRHKEKPNGFSVNSLNKE